MLLPIACLLTSVVDLGYWIYIFPARGYWFSQSAGYLLMLMLLWVARSTTPRKWHFVWYLIAFRLYPELGWFALLFILCLALSEKPTWRELIGLLVLIVTPSIWHTQEYSYWQVFLVSRRLWTQVSAYPYRFGCLVLSLCFCRCAAAIWHGGSCRQSVPLQAFSSPRRLCSTTKTTSTRCAWRTMLSIANGRMS